MACVVCYYGCGGFCTYCFEPQPMFASDVVDLSEEADDAGAAADWERADRAPSCADDEAFARQFARQLADQDAEAARAVAASEAFARRLSDDGDDDGGPRRGRSASEDAQCRNDAELARALNEAPADYSEGDAAFARDAAAARALHASFQAAGAVDLTGSDDDDAAVARQTQWGDGDDFDASRVLARRLGAEVQDRYSGAAPPPTTPPPWRIFVGDKFYLNTLAPVVAGSGQSVGNEALCTADVVDAEILLWHTPSIRKAFFSTFGCSFAYVHYLLRGSRLLETPGAVVRLLFSGPGPLRKTS
jgi:hypothetical protein